MILQRYLNKEVVKTTIAVTIIVMMIFLSNQFVRYLGSAAQGKLAGAVLFEVIILEVPHLLGLLLPFGLFLGILVALGRMYADSEMAVLRASGISQRRLLKMLFPVIGFFFIVALLLNLWVTPKALSVRDRLLKQTGKGAIVQTILPGRFQQSADGKTIYYIQTLSRDRRHMKDIFVADQVKAKGKQVAHWDVLAARGGYQYIDGKTGDKFVVTTNGHRYSGIPGQRDYQLVRFKKYAVRVDSTSSATKHPNQDTFSTTKLIGLWKLHNPYYIAELQWRFSMPISLILLACIAVPLSRLRPRSGRYAKIMPALLIYTVYVNLMFLARSWVQTQKIGFGTGMWWVQYILVIFMLFLWFNQSQQGASLWRLPKFNWRRAQ